VLWQPRDAVGSVPHQDWLLRSAANEPCDAAQERLNICNCSPRRRRQASQLLPVPHVTPEILLERPRLRWRVPARK
jgi:hypothetical protein